MTVLSKLPWTSTGTWSSRYASKLASSTAKAYSPAGSEANRNCPRSLVTVDAVPPINAGELKRTDASGRTPPDSSLTVPDSVPVSTWANDSLARSMKPSTTDMRKQHFAVIGASPWLNCRLKIRDLSPCICLSISGVTALVTLKRKRGREQVIRAGKNCRAGREWSSPSFRNDERQRLDG